MKSVKVLLSTVILMSTTSAMAQVSGPIVTPNLNLDSNTIRCTVTTPDMIKTFEVKGAFATLEAFTSNNKQYKIEMTHMSIYGSDSVSVTIMDKENSVVDLSLKGDLSLELSKENIKLNCAK